MKEDSYSLAAMYDEQPIHSFITITQNYIIQIPGEDHVPVWRGLLHGWKKTVISAIT